MLKLHENDRLSEGDALFLYLERPGMPLNIASVAVFDGAISLADCIEFVGSKLPLIPRYYQRVVIPPLNLGLPAWEYDPEFDIHNHIREVRHERAGIGDSMAAFFQQTWLLWWIIGLMVVLRWFQVVSVDDTSEDLATGCHGESGSVRDRWSYPS